MPLPSGFVFKPGRRPAVRPIGYKDMSFFMTSLPPSPPSPPYDLTKGLNGFQMLGNGPDPTLTGPFAQYAATGVGDCGPDMAANLVYVGCHIQGLPYALPSANTMVGWYLSYAGGDNGIVNSSFFAYWLKNKTPWAPNLRAVAGVNYRDFDELMAYCHLFGGVMIGSTITQGNMDQTNTGEPWDVIGNPTILGGHDTLLLPCQPEPGMAEVATWGIRQQVTQAWVEQNVEEADAAIRQSEVPHGIAGVDDEKLVAYMQQLIANPI